MIISGCIEEVSNLDSEGELRVNIMKQDDGLLFCPSEAVSYSDMVEERRLLGAHGHVHHCNISIVELIESVSTGECQLLKVDVTEVSVHSEANKI